MAGILDPKTRFFDTYLTKEGRRQLSSGELRMRFISFSDSQTIYEQSELGIIDTKDGAAFFEAMSRPQDSIITENESIVNMMEVRDPALQPAFLIEPAADGVAMTNAAMFGKEILVPPDGRIIVPVTSSGVDRKYTSYDIRLPLFASGSTSQEVFYDAKVNGFRGWWLFDESYPQLETVEHLVINSKISQNLSSSSPLGTNAAFIKRVGGANIADTAPNFSNNSISIVSDIGKSYKLQDDTFIRINLTQGNYNVVGGGDNADEYLNQVSVWFYINQSGYDADNDQTMIQLFNGNIIRARVYSVANVLKVDIFNSNGTALNPLGRNVSTEVSAEKWHRVSIVYGSIDFVRVVLDGDLNKSLAANAGSWAGLNATDVILGNYASDPSAAPDNNKRLDGFLLECQYFTSDGTKPVPAQPIDTTILDEWRTIKSDLVDNNYDLSGIETAGIDGEQEEVLDYFLRLKNATSSFVTLSGKLTGEIKDEVAIRDASRKISVFEAQRKWIDYYPIAHEAALYFSVLGRPYVKEEQLQRGTHRIQMKDMIAKAEMVMSGTLYAYKQLMLLGHVDLGVTKEQQGIEIRRSRMLRSDEGDLTVGATLPQNEPTLFKTRLEEYPIYESVYGQKNNYNDGSELPHASTATGPVAGQFFLKEATAYHLNEIMDNDLDNDSSTFSSSRLPNYFFLPPICVSRFNFDPSGEDPSQDSYRLSWREFLRSLAAGTRYEGPNDGYRPITADAVADEYKKWMHHQFHSLIDNDTIDNLFKNIKPWENDSNEDYVYYLTRDINYPPPGPNKILFENLSKFNEHIEFTKTSQFNNSFVQMFECAQDEGKAVFKKLAIRDLGVIRRTANNYEGQNNAAAQRGNIVGDLRTAGSPGTRIENTSAEYSELVHVFAFGKLLHDDKNLAVPGTEIYFFPLFVMEFIIGDD